MSKRQHRGLTTEQILSRMREGDFVDQRDAGRGEPILGQLPRPDDASPRPNAAFWRGLALVLAVDLALVLIQLAEWW